MNARIALALAALLVSGCSTVDVKSLPDSHGHKIQAHKLQSSDYHERDLISVNPHDLKLFKPADMEHAENPGRTKEAVVAAMRHKTEGYPVPVLLVYRDDRKTLAFISKTWPNRPLSNLTWINDKVLAFDLYGGDDLGWHYVLDASVGSIIHAAPFADGADVNPDLKKDPKTPPAEKPVAPQPAPQPVPPARR